MKLAALFLSLAPVPLAEQGFTPIVNGKDRSVTVGPCGISSAGTRHDHRTPQAGIIPSVVKDPARAAVELVTWDKMATVHMSEAEVARDLHAVLAKVQQGIEVVIEQDHRPVAIVRSPFPKGRLLSECIALAEARGTTAIPDDGFMKDVEEGIAERGKPWNPPNWE